MTTAEAAALARNDRYLREFVEALQMCPYARRCRESGKLHRRVLLEGAAAAAIEEIEALPEESVEVALLIFPDAPVGSEEAARHFEAFCAGIRPRLRRFYAVAFHPDLPRDLGDAHRAVQLIRRAPDPTLQLVRASVLREVRGDRSGGSRFIDLTRTSLEQALALASPLSLSERIGEANLGTLLREGPDEVESLLCSFRHP